MQRSWKLTLAGLAVAGTTAVVVPTVASAAPADAHGRLELACARVPNLTLRVDNAIDRLQADATTIGSLAWLQAQIDKATTQGRTELVTVLQNRLAVRRAKLDLLQARTAALAEIGKICDAHLGSGGTA
jgi:hypothetical protein